MDFGNRTSFGITLELDENYGGSWLFGRFCYWIGGYAVGNYDDGTSLADLVVNMKYIIGDCGKRFCPPLLDMPTDRAFQIIRNSLDSTSDEIFRYVPQDFLPARFDVCIPVDVFDSWKIFLVDGVNVSKLFFFDIDASQLSAVTLAVGKADDVFRAAYSYLDSFYESVVNSAPDAES